MKKFLGIIALFSAIFCVFTFGVSAEEVAEASAVKEWIDGITNSALWASIGSVLLTAVGVIALLKKKLGGIAELIKGKADTVTIVNATANAYAEIAGKVDKELLPELEALRKENKQLLDIFSVFVANVRMNDAAKSEILQIIAGVKEYKGSTAEIVEKVTAKIEEKKATEPKEETPALDAIKEDIVVGGI